MRSLAGLAMLLLQPFPELGKAMEVHQEKLVQILQRFQESFKTMRAISGLDIDPGLQADEAALEALLAPRTLLELGMVRVLGLGRNLGELPGTLRVKVQAWPEASWARFNDWGRRGAELSRRFEELLRKHIERMELVDNPEA